MAERWMIHLDEPTRALAHGVVTATGDALARLVAPVWSVDPNGRPSLVVDRAVSLERRRRSAVLSFVEGGLVLTIEGAGRPGCRIPLRISDDRTRDGGLRDPTGDALSTLALWRDRLSRPVDDDHRGEARAFTANMAQVVLGAIGRSAIRWDAFAVHCWPEGGQAVQVFRAGVPLPIAFRTPVPGRREPAMSASLSEELARLGGSRVHVSEMYHRIPGDLPHIGIGPPPVAHLRSAETDAMMMLRAIAAVPDTFRLRETS